MVEDDPTSLELVSLLLRMEGYTVFGCRDADTALVLVNRLRPHVILLDLDLRGDAGLRFVRELKAHPVHRAKKVVAVTASAMGGDRERALAAGCDGYITKPIDTRSFSTVIGSYLGADTS